MKKSLFSAQLGLGLVLLAGLTSAVHGQTRLAFSGGLSRVPSIGSESDYEAGRNDFPVTPAHSPAFFGLTLGRVFSPGFGVAIEANYFFASSLTLRDPSDEDTVRTKSAAHLDIALDVLWEFSHGRVRPYLVLGAGASVLTGVQSKTIRSDYGYEVTLAAPEQKTDALFKAGAGISYIFGSGFGLCLEGNYIRTTQSKDRPAVDAFAARIGIFILFSKR